MQAQTWDMGGKIYTSSFPSCRLRLREAGSHLYSCLPAPGPRRANFS